MENTKFTPEEFERYYCIGDQDGEFRIVERINLNLTVNKKQISQGNCFRNRDEADEKLKKILETLKEENAKDTIQ